jgi:hypothetical protein
MRSREDAQWLLLSAVVVSIGLGALVLLLNTAMLSGHSSVQSMTSFPKDDIRDLRSLSLNEAMLIGEDVNQDPGYVGHDKVAAFNASYDDFINETSQLYLLHGALINVTYMPVYYDDGFVRKITNVTVKIVYYDYNTIYTENKTIGIPG